MQLLFEEQKRKELHDGLFSSYTLRHIDKVWAHILGANNIFTKLARLLKSLNEQLANLTLHFEVSNVLRAYNTAGQYHSFCNMLNIFQRKDVNNLKCIRHLLTENYNEHL